MLFAPNLLVDWFTHGQETSSYFVRFIGAALIGYSVTNWIYSQSEQIVNMLPATYGNLTSLSLATLVDLAGLWFGPLNSLAWLIFGLHVTFTIAFMRCVFIITDYRRNHVATTK
jgi:hypothetical protein